MKPSPVMLRAFLFLCLVVAPALARQAVLSKWSHTGATWSCNKQASVTLPTELNGAPDAALLSVKMPKSHFFAAFGLSQDKTSALAAIKQMRKHLKSLGTVKLGKVAHIDSNPKLQLVAREGQVKVDDVFYYTAMGYFTNKAQYLSFIVFYQANQSDKFKPIVAKMMNSVKL
jgi:hypothetical protein